jgi:hypothetical protein
MMTKGCCESKVILVAPKFDGGLDGEREWGLSVSNVMKMKGANKMMAE